MGADGIHLLLGILVDKPPLLQVAVAAVLDEAAQVVAVYHFPGGMNTE